MDTQFLHVSFYGRKKHPGAKRHETALGMLNEAARQPSATGHLRHPCPPKQLIGASPLAIAQRVEELAKCSRDSRGRKLRSDAHLLMCIVASYPRPSHEALADEGDYESWLQLVLEWMQKGFATQLAGVVEHQDEAYLHVHAFVLPPVAPDGQLQWNQVHPGRRAKKVAAAAGASKRDQDVAYVSAMQEWQNDFHQAVGQRFGHARLSIQRARRPRAEHLLIRDLEAENACLAARVEVLESQLEQLGAAAHKDLVHDLTPVSDVGTLPGEDAIENTQGVDDQYDAENAAERGEESASQLDCEDDYGTGDGDDFDDEQGDPDWDTFVNSSREDETLDVKESSGG